MADVKDVELLKRAWQDMKPRKGYRLDLLADIEARLREIAWETPGGGYPLPREGCHSHPHCAAYEALKDLGLLEEPMDWAKAEAEIRAYAWDLSSLDPQDWQSGWELGHGLAREFRQGCRSRALYNRIMGLRKR